MKMNAFLLTIHCSSSKKNLKHVTMIRGRQTPNACCIISFVQRSKVAEAKLYYLRASYVNFKTVMEPEDTIPSRLDQGYFRTLEEF